MSICATADFAYVGEVVADSRRRISFGRADIHADDRFLVRRSETGEILLTPLASIPARELDIWENPALLATIMAGLKSASEGNVVSWPEFDAELDALDDEDEAEPTS